MTTYVSDTNATSDVYSRLALSWRGTGTGASPMMGYYDGATAHSLGATGNSAIVGIWNNTVSVRFNVFGTEVDDVAWLILVELPTTDATTGFNGVRLRWKRQVSPAPTTARFTDVPTTHVFFQYIEALAASGTSFEHDEGCPIAQASAAPCGGGGNLWT